MCPMVVVFFLYTWLILGVTFMFPNMFLQLSSTSLVYSSRLYENFMPFRFLYTIYLFFVTLRNPLDYFWVFFYRKHQKPKTPQNPCKLLVDILLLWAQTSDSFLKFPCPYSSFLDAVSIFQSFHCCTWPLFLCPDKALYGKKHMDKAQKAVAVHTLSTAD